MRVYLDEAERREAEAGRFVCVALPRPLDYGADQRARSVFVARVDGLWRGWANVCRHRGVPLDFNAPDAEAAGAGAGEARLAPMAQDRFHLVCHSHGALYRPDDGACISGPCPGAKLHEVAVVEEGARIGLEIPDLPA
jgi:nitrite reductase/ring-hydroxylating ferredoxin subunit